MFAVCPRPTSDLSSVSEAFTFNASLLYSSQTSRTRLTLSYLFGPTRLGPAFSPPPTPPHRRSTSFSPKVETCLFSSHNALFECCVFLSSDFAIFGPRNKVPDCQGRLSTSMGRVNERDRTKYAALCLRG